MARFKKKNNAFFQVGTIGWGLISGAFILLIFGIATAFFPKIFKYTSGSYIYNLCQTLSSALIASSVLTITLEYANNFQRKKDLDDIIKEMRGTAMESTLRELIGDDNILNEVKTHILYQNYIRKNFNVSINLRWDIGKSNLLIKELTMNYFIYNKTSQKISYILAAIEEKENQKNCPETTKITSISYEIMNVITHNSIELNYYNEAQIAAWNNGRYKNNEFVVSAELEIYIPPETYCKCTFTSSSLLKPKTNYPIVSLTSVSDMTVDVYYPTDIKVSSLGIHPDPEKFRLDVNETNHKRWTTKGLLPGQGISLSISKESQICQSASKVTS